MNSIELKEKKQHDRRKRRPLFFHRVITFLMYLLSFAISLTILMRPDAKSSLIIILSTGAIFATFGSAISSLFCSFQNELMNRIMTNINVLQTDILKQSKPWRRWPFIPRIFAGRLLNDDTMFQDLSNPELSIDVGTHEIKITIPTVQEDFYDLQLISNYYQLKKYKKAKSTLFSTKYGEKQTDTTKLSNEDEYMAYNCLLDIWTTIFKYRVSKYVMHLGCGLTIFGVTITCIMVLVS